MSRTTQTRSVPWNKGKLLGQKLPLKLKEVWAIRIRLQVAGASETRRCSTCPSIASFAGAIW